MKSLFVCLLLILFSTFVGFGCGDDDDDSSGSEPVDDDSVDDDDDAIDDDDDDDDDNNDDNDDNDDDNDDFIPPTPVYGYYEETMDWDWIQSRLPKFAQYDLTLFLAMFDSHVGDPDLLELLFEAQAQGVPVRAWVVIDYEDGYWAGESNADLVYDAFMAFADWFIEEDAPVDWFVIDMEMDINRITAITDSLDAGEILDALMILIGNISPNKFNQAVDTYTQMVHDLEDLGFYSMVVTYPQVLDDMIDEDTFIQDLMEVPVSPVPWHEVSTMVYTTHFDDYAGMDFGPYLVYDYALSTVEHFGDAASIALGVVRNTDSPADLAAEIAASKAAGVERIQVYSYTGAFDTPDPDAWHQAFDAEPAVPGKEGSTVILRGLTRLADLIF